jgi:hypothetical protein
VDHRGRPVEQYRHLPQGRDERAGHEVADGDPGHSRADRVDDASALGYALTTAVTVTGPYQVSPRKATLKVVFTRTT